MSLNTLTAPCLTVCRPGQFVTIQDGGRVGWRRYGVPRGGAMDRLSLATANALVGNPAWTPALEFMFVGGEYQMHAEVGWVAVTGGKFPVFRNGERISAHRSIRLERGDMLRIGAALDVVWGYMAIAGGITVPLELGSASTHIRSEIGGLAGKALQMGDVVPFRRCSWADRAVEEERESVLFARRRPPADPAIRVIMGPQDEYFEPASVEVFLSEGFVVTHRMDRMGYHLLGPRLFHTRSADVVSDGVVAGSIQIPGSGQPIALLADCQPTGGYPKIATVLSADLGRLAQCRPGSVVRFRAVTVGEAHYARLDYLERIERLPAQIVRAPYDHALRLPT